MTTQIDVEAIRKRARALNLHIEKLSERGAGGHSDRCQEDRMLLAARDALILAQALLRDSADEVDRLRAALADSRVRALEEAARYREDAKPDFMVINSPDGATVTINGHSYTVTPDGLERAKEKRRVTLHVGMTKGGNVLVSEAGPYTAEHGYSACSRVTLVEGEFEE